MKTLGYLVCLALILAFRWETALTMLFYGEDNPLTIILVVLLLAGLLQMVLSAIIGVARRVVRLPQKRQE